MSAISPTQGSLRLGISRGFPAMPLPCSWLWECTWWRHPCRASPPSSRLPPRGFRHWDLFVTSQRIFWAALCPHSHQSVDRCPLQEAWGHLQETEEHVEARSAGKSGWPRLRKPGRWGGDTGSHCGHMPRGFAPEIQSTDAEMHGWVGWWTGGRVGRFRNVKNAQR